MTFAAQVIAFHRQLKPDWQIPDDVQLIYPFEEQATWHVFESFYNEYFSDTNKRHFLFGINPGRFGAGITGIPFTDPKILDEQLSIENPFKKRNELSSIFVYEMINALGGADAFYNLFYITSICPLGFIANGKNLNYYDRPDLQNAVLKQIISNINQQKSFGAHPEVAFSMGQGKNYKFLLKLNEEHSFFRKIIPLPHPRWVMQYRLKRKQEYIDEYVRKLSATMQ